MSQPNPALRKPRRRLVITVRVLMLLVLIVAAGLAWKVNRAHVQRQAVARIRQAGGSVSHDYTYTLAESSWAPDWLRRLESVTIEYSLPVGAGSDAQPGETGTIRSFRFYGVNPNTLPSVTGSIHISISANGVKTAPLPSFEKIDSMALNEIELANFYACAFDDEMASATAAVLLESAAIKGDPSVEAAMLAANLSAQSNSTRKTAAPDNDNRALWKRLERYNTYASPWQPAWLQRLIGDEYFQEVVSAGFHLPVTDDQLAPVAGLDRLRELSLGKARNLTDAGLAHLAGLSQLQELEIGYAPGITDAGLAHLAGLAQLRKLYVHDAPGITDAGLAHLSRITELRDLNLSSTGVSGPGLAQLASLPHLQELRIYPIKDSGMPGLANLTALRELNLLSNPITDAGLAHLSGLTRLQTLNLSTSRFTNEGLRGTWQA